MAFSLEGDVFANIAKDYIKVGDHLTFRATATDLSDFNLDEVTNPLIIISSVPSLNTKVCQMQSERWDKIIRQYEDIKLLSISCDLPFASNRICDAAPSEQHQVLSDYRYHEFGHKTKLIFKDVQFLCRALLILNKNHQVVYVEIANPVKSEINFTAAEAFIQNYIKKHNLK